MVMTLIMEIVMKNVMHGAACGDDCGGSGNCDNGDDSLVIVMMVAMIQKKMVV